MRATRIGDGIDADQARGADHPDAKVALASQLLKERDAVLVTPINSGLLLLQPD